MVIPAGNSWPIFAKGWRILPIAPEDPGLALCAELERLGADIEWHPDNANPQKLVSRDETLASMLLSEAAPSRILRVWRNHHALVVPRSFRTKVGFGKAISQCPIPVCQRRSGGTAVVHGPRILNISLIQTISEKRVFSFENAFGELGSIMINALSQMGVSARLGDVSSAHCPGRFTLVAQGQKLAGTAAFVRNGKDHRVVVTHANLALLSIPQDLQTIIAFEQALGGKPDYKANAHTDLDSLVTANQSKHFA